MATKDVVDDLIETTTREAKNDKRCINCKYSYFSKLQESGLCHNQEQVRGHWYPKVVNEFYRCEYWEPRTNKKSNMSKFHGRKDTKGA